MDLKQQLERIHASRVVRDAFDTMVFANLGAAALTLLVAQSAWVLEHPSRQSTVAFFMVSERIGAVFAQLVTWYEARRVRQLMEAASLEAVVQQRYDVLVELRELQEKERQ